MRIYTRTGDTGETGLFGGGRVAKDDIRVAAYGEVDELNAVLGVAGSALHDGTIAAFVAEIQPDLFILGAHLATPPETRGRRPALPALPVTRIAEFERRIDEAEAELPALDAFVMPGGSAGGAALHLLAEGPVPVAGDVRDLLGRRRVVEGDRRAGRGHRVAAVADARDVHEAGHALYEQGIHDAFQRTPLGETISLGVHESQSRRKAVLCLRRRRVNGQ